MKDAKDVNELYLLDPAGFVERLNQAMAASESLDPRLVTKEDNRESSSGFNLKTLREVLHEVPEQRDWLLEDTLLPNGTSLWVGKPKSGKSTAGKELGRGVADIGGLFLGRQIMRTGLVMYLAMEEDAWGFTEQYRKSGYESDNIIIHFGKAPDNPIAELEKAIKQYSPVLVFVDTLNKITRFENINDYSEVDRIMGPIVDLARRTNCHIATSHHAGKEERADGDSVLGSTALFGAVDTVLTFKRKPDETHTVSTVQRYGKNLPETIMELDEETGAVSAGVPLSVNRSEQQEEKVLSALGSEKLTEQEIKEAVGGNHTRTASAIRSLRDKGVLERTGEGVSGKPYYYQKAEVEEGADDDESLDSGFESKEETLESSNKPPESDRQPEDKKVIISGGRSYVMEEVSLFQEGASTLQAPNSPCPSCGSTQWWQLSKEAGGTWNCGVCHPQSP